MKRSTNFGDQAHMNVPRTYYTRLCCTPHIHPPTSKHYQMTKESLAARLDRLQRKVEEESGKQEMEMSLKGTKADKADVTVNEQVDGKGKDKDEDQVEDKKDEGKVEGKKRRWNSDVQVSERYNEEDADITIISSDNVAFKVHSLLLTRAS